MSLIPERDSEAPPRVSVVMPVRDGAEFINEALRSALDQTWRDLEVIVVDDNSIDATFEILQAAEKNDERIRICHLEKSVGIVGALNHGLEVARGEYVARLDADDVSLPDRFALQVDFLDRNPEVVAASGRVLYMDRDGDPLGCPELPCEHHMIDAHHMTGVGGGICHSAAMLRREKLLEIGAYRQEFSAAEDLDLFLRLAEVGRLANIPETIQKVRLYPASHSLRSRTVQRDQCFEALRQACRRRKVAFDPNVFAFPPEAEDDFGTPEFFARFAISHGQTRTALKHAIHQVRFSPLRPASWRTLASIMGTASGLRRFS